MLVRPTGWVWAYFLTNMRQTSNDIACSSCAFQTKRSRGAHPGAGLRRGRGHAVSEQCNVRCTLLHWKPKAILARAYVQSKAGRTRKPCGAERAGLERHGSTERVHPSWCRRGPCPCHMKTRRVIRYMHGSCKMKTKNAFHYTLDAGAWVPAHVQGPKAITRGTLPPRRRQRARWRPAAQPAGGLC